jgi:hypothetical protein
MQEMCGQIPAKVKDPAVVLDGGSNSLVLPARGSVERRELLIKGRRP